MAIRKILSAGIGMVLAEQAALVVAKLLGWEPVARHSWLTLTWFPWAFFWASMVLAAVMLLIGIGFDRGMWKLEAWLAKEAKS